MFTQTSKFHTTKASSEIQCKFATVYINTGVEKNILAQKVSIERISFTNEAWWYSLRKDCWLTTGNPGSVIVPQYGSSKITVFVWGENAILKFLRNTK